MTLELMWISLCRQIWIKNEFDVQTQGDEEDLKERFLSEIIEIIHRQ